MKKKSMTITEFAKMGGNATLKKYGKDHYKRISQLGVEARKRKEDQKSSE